MNDTPNDRPTDRGTDREEARRKLVGRAMVIGFLALVAIYAVFTFLGVAKR